MVKADKRSTLVVLAASALAYCATPWFGFVFDDRKQVLASPALQSVGSIAGYFTRPGYLVGDLSYYRPLFGAWLNLNYALFGLRSPGWHIALLLLHALATFLCYRVVRAIVQDDAIAVVAGLLFAVHPVHVESVAWISGGTDPLAGVFILLSFLLCLSAQESWVAGVFSWLAFAASLLAKETALLFPLLVLIYFLALEKQKLSAALKHSAPYFLVAATYLVVRIHILGGFSHTQTALSWRVLFLTWPSVAAFYGRLLLLPVGLSVFYDTSYVNSASFTGFFAPLLALFATGALVAWWIRRLWLAGQQDRGRQVVFFVAWIVLFLIPAFNLMALDPGEIAHDRYLYISSIGFCALASIALRQLAGTLKLSRPVGTFAMAGVVLVLCTATLAQSMFWKNDLNLYIRGATVAPDNINAQNNLANVYLETGDILRGIAIHQSILKLHPQYADSYFNLGLAYYNLGDFVEAQSYLSQAISLHPTAMTYLYLGLAQFKKGDLVAAEQSLLAATRLEQRPEFYSALGVLHESEGKLPLALQDFEHALSLDAGQPSVSNEIAKIRRQLKGELQF